MTPITGTILCQTSTGQEKDWEQLYLSAFPAEQRDSIENIRAKIANGSALLHRTVNSKNELLCFSHIRRMSNFVLLTYIATDSTKRSSGVGSKHMKRLLEITKELSPSYVGLFLEIPSTKEKGLTEDELKARQRRFAFYQRLGAKRSNKQYLMPTCGLPRPTERTTEGELLWIEFTPPRVLDKLLSSVIEEIYTKEYLVEKSDPLVVKILSQFRPARKATKISAAAGVVEKVLLRLHHEAGAPGDDLLAPPTRPPNGRTRRLRSARAALAGQKVARCGRRSDTAGFFDGASVKPDDGPAGWLDIDTVAYPTPEAILAKTARTYAVQRFGNCAGIGAT